jgi:Polysaccharide deacetylase
MTLRRLTSSLRSAWTKNGPEIRAILSGHMPPFVTAAGSPAVTTPPVFVFHGIEPARFEAQLRYLSDNGYRTLGADELEARLRQRDRQSDARVVALTFDDATWTFWTYAYPLLRRHGMRAILFAIPGLVPDDPTHYPSLEDVWAQRCTLAELECRATLQPLCIWHELAELHGSGMIDIESHSLTHARVPVSAQVRDFVHPGFSAGDYSNTDLPLSIEDDPERPERRLRLGAPVFAAASRLAGRPRFLEAPAMAQALVDHVAGRGGIRFFEQPRWRRELAGVLDAWPEERRGKFESTAQMRAAIDCELTRSKALLESRLPGKEVHHFCYPWFENCALADQLAAQAGYRTVHGGIAVKRRGRVATPLPVQRISEEYLFRLPGEDRSGIASIWLHRARSFVTRRKRALP